MNWRSSSLNHQSLSSLVNGPNRINLPCIATRRSSLKSYVVISNMASVTVTSILYNCACGSPFFVITHTSLNLLSLMPLSFFFLCFFFCKSVIKLWFGFVWGTQSRADINNWLNHLLAFITGEVFSTWNELHYCNVSYFIAETHVACTSFHSNPTICFAPENLPTSPLCMTAAVFSCWLG